MTTVVNTPGSSNSSDSSVGMVLGLIVLLVVLGLFFVYALPAIRGSAPAQPNGAIDVNVKLPGDAAPAPATAQ